MPIRHRREIRVQELICATTPPKTMSSCQSNSGLHDDVTRRRAFSMQEECSVLIREADVLGSA